MIQVVDIATGQVVREFCTYVEAVVFRRDVLKLGPGECEIRADVRGAA